MKMKQQSFEELNVNVNRFDADYRSKRSLNLLPNLENMVEDLFLVASPPPLWLTTTPPASNKNKHTECRNIDSSNDQNPSSLSYAVCDPKSENEGSDKMGNCSLSKDARDALAKESKEDVLHDSLSHFKFRRGESVIDDTWSMGGAEESKEWRLYSPSWVEEADEQMIWFAKRGSSSPDHGSAKEKGIQQQDLGPGSTRGTVTGRNRRSADLGVFKAEKYFSEIEEVIASFEGIEDDLVSVDSYVRSEISDVEGRSVGWGDPRSSAGSRDNASIAKLPSLSKSPKMKTKGSSNKPVASPSGRLGSILTRFKLSMSRKDVRENKATKTKVILSSDGLSAKSNVTSSGPNIGRRKEQQEHEHRENQPPAPAAPRTFYNGAHTLPPNGKPPSLVSRHSVSSFPHQPSSSSSSSSSATISVFPSPSVEDDPQSTFHVKAVTMDASHTSSVLTTLHRSPPCREGVQSQRNGGGDVPQLINLRKQQTMTVDNHLQNWTIVNELPPRIAEKGASLVHKKKSNREAFQRGFEDKAFRAYGDQVSFTNKQHMQKEKLDLYDSDSSSDLFELDTLGEVGMGLCRRDLPVFGAKG